MALYHFSVRHVSRGKGQMVVASAAYISGQRIHDSYYNKIHDYTSKSGVVFTEICRVTIDVTPCHYTKTVKYYRILISKPKP